MNGRTKWFLGAVVGLAALSALGVGACSDNPPPAPVRTFERAQRMDVACIALNRTETGATPRSQSTAKCGPVPRGQDPWLLNDHLFALVTQSTRGEVAMVDMTAGQVIDVDRTTPGLNFVPVGSMPTDVAVSPDGELAFVASAEPGKPALYALSTTRMLGNAFTSQDPPKLTDWPACRLPQVPIAVAVSPRGLGVGAPLPDAGTDASADASPDAGAPAAADSAAYDIVVVLAGDRHDRAKVLLLDPRPLQGVATARHQPIGAGSLAECPWIAARELAADVAGSFLRGPEWDDGIPYDAGAATPVAVADAGASGDAGDAGGDAAAPRPTYADQVDSVPLSGTRCVATADASAPLTRPAQPPGGNADPRPIAAVRDGQTLYVADDALPLIHVLDFSRAGEIRELAPLQVTSTVEPSRWITIRDLAVSPTTHDFKRYLYAVDKQDGNILVYDVTDPVSSPRVPLVRPHPHLAPFPAPDRLGFGSPVVNVTFARHDFPLIRGEAAGTGLLCNPNPNTNATELAPFDPADPMQGPFRPGGEGAYYRANMTGKGLTQGLPSDLAPKRLRGIFAFATLASGRVVTIDVDDWDASCRRPARLASDFRISARALPQPEAAAPDLLNPFHAPNTFGQGYRSSPVSMEAFYPVSAPHRTRSLYLLRDDPNVSKRIPNVSVLPELFDRAASLPTRGPESRFNPMIRPTQTPYQDPSLLINPLDPAPTKESLKTEATSGELLPGVRLSFEEPTVHIDQDWTVTYEGALPGLDGVAATVQTEDNYQSLSLRIPQPLFCRRGIEDREIAKERLSQMSTAMGGEPLVGSTAEQLADYVQLTDDLLPPSDPYWSLPNACWSDATPDASSRYALCAQTFASSADEESNRDFPILRAYDDHLVVGRFGFPNPDRRLTYTRQIVSTDPSNAPVLKLMQCCFHNQVRFKVRTGGAWLTMGSAYGLFHHVERDASGACVLSCDRDRALFNARAITLPKAYEAGALIPGRNSPLAMRNPVFSFFIRAGDSRVSDNGEQAPPVPRRDYVWRFSTRGQFEPITTSLSNTTISVSPQSMRYIDVLGQLAVVDGASQGLVLIDLGDDPDPRAWLVVRASYF